MQPYAPGDCGAEIAEVLRRLEWRVLIQPGRPRPMGLSYAIDCGAWGAHLAGRALDWVDLQRYQAALESHGRHARWAVVPDVVGDRRGTLALTETWLPVVRSFTLPLVAVQDGMKEADIEPWIGPECGIFVGGSTAWKWESLPRWGSLAERRGCHLHVGRCNSARHVVDCYRAGVSSFDGSGVVRGDWRRNLLTIAGAVKVGWAFC
jgi:hypothetical protein